MKLPKKKTDLLQLVENKVEEDIHLEYKESRALTGKKLHELAKDVSAFANADGGIIVYGIRETGGIPAELDDGLSHDDMTTERLEQKIMSNIAPALDSLDLARIPLGDAKYAYTVGIPKSLRAPHQERHYKRYYKRQNRQAIPMEDYEIQDLRTRRVKTSPLVRLDVVTKGQSLYLLIENIGRAPAMDLRFGKKRQAPWSQPGKEPQQLQRGIRCLPPGKKLRFYMGSATSLLSSKYDGSTKVRLRFSYVNPQVGHRFAEVFEFDVADLEGAIIWKSDLAELRIMLERQLRKLS